MTQKRPYFRPYFISLLKTGDKIRKLLLFIGLDFTIIVFILFIVNCVSFTNIETLYEVHIWFFVNALTHLMLLISFYSPWKQQKISGFIMFSGGIGKDQ